jgi:hypothetical protein
MKAEKDSEYRKRKGILVGSTDVQGFSPIHITLESLEEADCFYHFVNYCGNYYDGHYLEGDQMYAMTLEQFRTMKETTFYESYRAVYRPRRR